MHDRVVRVQSPMLALLAVPLMLLAVLAQDAAGVLSARPVDEAWMERTCPVDAVVVMGAAQYDGTPSPAFARRLDGALELYRRGCAEVVVVTGGRGPGDRFSEGEAGVDYLGARGVPRAALRDESEARTTVENLRNSAELVGRVRLAVVTDDLHAYRTAAVIRRLDLDATVAGVRVPSGRLSYALREVGALLSYRLGVFR